MFQIHTVLDLQSFDGTTKSYLFSSSKVRVSSRLKETHGTMVTITVFLLFIMLVLLFFARRSFKARFLRLLVVFNNVLRENKKHNTKMMNADSTCRHMSVLFFSFLNSSSSLLKENKMHDA